MKMVKRQKINKVYEIWTLQRIKWKCVLRTCANKQRSSTPIQICKAIRSAVTFPLNWNGCSTNSYVNFWSNIHWFEHILLIKWFDF